ncbi:MAG TPA: hypothetical protein VG407_02380 [Caulobacteraceae bacterium]|jgi:hypothetical protein|nr:hypothetical protein [Caulobacteraceae bacterium]
MADKRGAPVPGGHRGENSGDDAAPDAVGAPFRVLYRKHVDELHNAVRHYDLEDRDNFVHALWLVMQSGLSQKDFAEHRGFRASTVNRWVTGAKAPPPKRRPAIVRDALAMLETAIREGRPVIMGSYGEDDAELGEQAAEPTPVAPARPAVRARPKP